MTESRHNKTKGTTSIYPLFLGMHPLTLSSYGRLPDSSTSLPASISNSMVKRPRMEKYRTPPPTTTAASHSSLPPTELSAADFVALFDEIAELHAHPENPRKAPKEKPSGRTPEKVAPEAPWPLGRHTSRQLFPEDDRKNQAPISRPGGSGHLSRLAPGRRIQLIPPPREDPQTWRQENRRSSHEGHTRAA